VLLLLAGWQLREDPDMKRYLSIAVAVASIVSAGQVMAAEMDMSKATCKEAGAMSAAKTVAVALWVNGYVHGKAGNPVIDSDKAQANAEKVADYCRSNPDSTLTNTIEALAK
jgi:acid stress chaperone HdeB